MLKWKHVLSLYGMIITILYTEDRLFWLIDEQSENHYDAEEKNRSRIMIKIGEKHSIAKAIQIESEFFLAFLSFVFYLSLSIECIDYGEVGKYFYF